jgi:hypothetical protein
MTPIWAYFKLVSARTRLISECLDWGEIRDAIRLIDSADAQLRRDPAITVQVIQAAYRIATERFTQEFPE